MQTDKNIDQIRVKLEAAFQPFRCVVEVRDYGEKLRFKVLDNNGVSIIETDDIPVRELMDNNYLEDVIEQTRVEIHSRRPDFSQ